MVSLTEAASEPVSKASSAQRRMNPTEIEFALRDLVSKPYDSETFPYDLIAIFNASKVTVGRLKSGTTNKATQPGDVLWQKQFFFRPAQPGSDVGAAGDALAADPLTSRHKPRFILVTNGHQVHIRDLKFEETANVEFGSLDEQSDFLLPLAGYERRAIVEEHPADIKAAKKLKKLYDAILAANPIWSNGHHSHELNLLMTRLLFCFYAEDTGIFDTQQIFTNTVIQHTLEDGSDVATLLDRLFRVMNTTCAARPRSTAAVDAKFPYVNGSLFEDTVGIPQFSRTARRQLLECGDLDWTTINPDIFGSMIQTIAQDDTRGELGMHYTSRPNIMNLLKPLFLEDLNEAFEKAKDSSPKLEALLGRFAMVRVLDPACGSGNFLVIAYKELRELEMRTLLRLAELNAKNPLRLSSISIEHFFGLDVVDFACETAKLSLWIAEYQMDSQFRDLFGMGRPPLPLGKIATIHNVNAIRADWQLLCPPIDHAEVYVCGNPPYQGSVVQSEDQKSDITFLFANRLRAYKDLNYISCWFLKAAEYMQRGAISCAFVSTNSICQGEHVAMLWPQLYSYNLEIGFAYTSFKWRNNASNNAGVTCVIVGLFRAGTKRLKSLYTDGHVSTVPLIGPYLVAGTNTIVRKRSTPLSTLPEISLGSKPTDGGNLLLSPSQRSALIAADPRAAALTKQYFGSEELIKGKERWCLWISDAQVVLANDIPDVRRRIEAVRTKRRGGGTQARGAANTPHRFAYVSYQDAEALLIPEVSSERRRYFQIGLLPRGCVISNQGYALYNPPAHLFSLLSSRMQFLWGSTVGGRMDNRLRYSAGLVYNTFPVPDLSEEQKRVLTDNARAIVRARGAYPGKTIAWLYNPETMPDALSQAHIENDSFIEKHIYGREFKDDTHRVEFLFELYERARNQQGGTPLIHENGVHSA